METTFVSRWVRAGLLTLPLYWVVLAYATRQPQPDQESDPEGWARFVTTPQYLVEHLLSSVVGAVLVILGSIALGALLAGTRAARSGLGGMVLAVAGQVLFTVPGVISTFATPAIGVAYLGGNQSLMALVFPEVLGPIFASALLLAVIGNLLIGIAIWRSELLPRRTGVAWVVGIVLFYLLGAALGVATTGASLPTQPVGAAVMALAAGALAWRAVRSGGPCPRSTTHVSAAAER